MIKKKADKRELAVVLSLILLFLIPSFKPVYAESVGIKKCDESCVKFMQENIEYKKTRGKIAPVPLNLPSSLHKNKIKRLERQKTTYAMLSLL